MSYLVPQSMGGGGGGGHHNNKNNKEDNNLKGQLSDAIVSEKPNIKWEDVAGL